MMGKRGFDRTRLAIRFLFGFFPGILLGFGFWIQNNDLYALDRLHHK